MGEVEMGEMPIMIRRVKLILAYWVKLDEHCETHPATNILKDLQDYNETKLSF